MPRYTTTNHQIFLNDGSASAPSLTFSSDTSTGMYFNSGPQIRWTINGTLAAFLNASGTGRLNAYQFALDPGNTDVILTRKAAATLGLPLGGAASDTFAVGGVANINTTAVGNVGVGEDDLITYALPASALSANGKAVRIRAWGTAANNANAKTVKLLFGTATILTTALTVSVADSWWIEGLVIRTGASTQDTVARLEETGANAMDMEVGTATQTDTAAITIKCTGTATANNDIVQEGLLVEFLN